MKTVKDYTQYIIDFKSINKGMQLLFRFDNNYGVSLVSNSFSYGNKQEKFEIAIIKFNSEDGDNFELTYDTHITNDVLGYQSKEDVISVIEKVILL
jgi:hypothetical protein